jgi:predicted MFS family arabinose efflux permease
MTFFNAPSISAPISSVISTHLKWQLLNNLLTCLARLIFLLMVFTMVGSLLNTSLANDGPINVTNPCALFLIICLIVCDHTELFLGFKPLATLIMTGL